MHYGICRIHCFWKLTHIRVCHDSLASAALILVAVADEKTRVDSLSFYLILLSCFPSVSSAYISYVNCHFVTFSMWAYYILACSIDLGHDRWQWVSMHNTRTEVAKKHSSIINFITYANMHIQEQKIHNIKSCRQCNLIGLFTSQQKTIKHSSTTLSFSV